MEVEPTHQPRTSTYAVLIAGLAIMVVMLAVMMFLTLDQARLASGPHQKYFLKMSWILLVGLALTFLMLVWIITRLVKARAMARAPHGRTVTPYVDAWSLAGKRFDLKEHQDLDPAVQEQKEQEGQDEGDEEDGEKPEA